MARVIGDSGLNTGENGQHTLTLQAESNGRIDLPSSDFVADATMTREGSDLVLQTPNGETVVVEGYFSADPAPLLISPDGAVLTSNLVDSFSRSPAQFAANNSANDESPVGAVEEVKGHATVTRADGTVETIAIGTPIYQGDVIQTDAQGAVNITFIDETSMAVSENARFAIDQYTFDPETESGTTNFSVLRGLFVFTSGLIGRDDPDDVKIDTPVGSIGIRGTIIAGQIDPSGESNITVLEGAIVVTNGTMNTTLSQQFETVRLTGFGEPMESVGVVPANDISARFSTVGTVLPTLFSMMNDAAAEQSSPQPAQTAPVQQTPTSEQPTQTETAPKTDSQTPTSQTQPTTAPVADMQSMDLTGNTSTMGLPSSNTVTGQPTVNSTGTLSGSNVFTTTQQVAPPPTTTAPPPPTSTTTSGPLAGTTADQTLPPPPPNAPPGPVLNFTSTPVSDTAGVNTLVGNFSTGIAGTTYVLAATSINDYTLVADGVGGVNVYLTSAGADKLAASLHPTSSILETLSVTATLSGGAQLTRTLTTPIYDSNAARTFDLEGSVAGVAHIPDNLNNNAGYTISALGDINNDGFDDFIFSNNTNDVGQNHSYIVHGQAGLLSGNVAGIVNTYPNLTLGSDHSETRVSGIGDFDGDGIEDYMVSQHLATGGGTVAIVNGSNPGNTTAQVMGTDFTTGYDAGASISGIGDVNNDGYSDVVIGAPGTDKAILWQGFDVNWGVSTTTNTDFSYTANNTFGSTVEGVGDFNGDGYNDFMVGGYGAGASNNGIAQLYKGYNGGAFLLDSVSGAAGEQLGEEISYLGDINGDGFSDVLIGGANNAGGIYFGNSGSLVKDVNINVPTTTGYTFNGAGGIGDYNGDGYDDYVLSLTDSTKSYTFVVFGKETAQMPTEITLNYLKNGNNALEFTWNETNDLEISRIGDINGDGYDDFAIGGSDVNGANTGNGGLEIFYGHDTGKVTSGTTATASNQSFVGNGANNVFSDGAYNNISMRGGTGTDKFELSHTNFLGIDGGGGVNDMISAQANLNFTNVNYEQISGIEKIGFGENGTTVTLTMENLFNLLKTSDNGTLKIENLAGITGSTLILSDGAGGDNYTTGPGLSDARQLLDDYAPGSSVASATNDGTYNTFHIGGYTLMIDQNIAIDAQ